MSAMMGGGYMHRMERRPHGDPVKPRALDWDDLPVGEAMDEFERDVARTRERKAMQYQELQEKYGFIPMDHKAPQFFPIREGKIYDDKGQPIPNNKRIWREDTGDTLAVHTDTYSMVPYETHFGLFEEAIRTSDLRDELCVVATDMSGNGAKIFRQYLFPDVRHVIDAKTRREIALRIVMFDSYDGSTALVGKSGYWDFACANTSFFGLTLGDVKFRHTGDMDAKVLMAAKSLTAAAVDFKVQAVRCDSWTGVKLLAQQVEDLVNGLPQGNKGLTNEIVSSWAKEGDNTLWGVHQALTSWSSKDVPMRTACDRAKRVTTLVEGKDWKQFEPA